MAPIPICIGADESNDFLEGMIASGEREKED